MFRPHDPTGAITSYIDVAQLTLYAFWLFFFCLVIHLILENKREGFPLVTRRKGERLGGILPMPRQKALLLRDGSVKVWPKLEEDPPVNAMQAEGFEGAPYVPLGDPMQDGVGPAAYAGRKDAPELTFSDQPRNVPIRAVPEHRVPSEDPDPRGLQVITADGLVAGIVSDIWVDRAEELPRYLEVETPGPAPRRVIVPYELVRIRHRARGWIVKLACVTAPLLAAAPAPREPDTVTAREEDRIQAYFASGHLYATPQRLGPWL